MTVKVLAEPFSKGAPLSRRLSLARPAEQSRASPDIAEQSNVTPVKGVPLFSSKNKVVRGRDKECGWMVLSELSIVNLDFADSLGGVKGREAGLSSNIQPFTGGFL